MAGDPRNGNRLVEARDPYQVNDEESLFDLRSGTGHSGVDQSHDAKLEHCRMRFIPALFCGDFDPRVGGRLQSGH